MPLEIHQFPCLQDNYGYLLRDDAGKVACVDTPDADAIAAELGKRGWTLDLILNTHWHPDHAGGNEALKARYGAIIYGPQEVTRIAPLDHAEGTYRSAKGTIRSSWRRVGVRGFLLDVEIPANATAEVHLPAARSGTLREGRRELGGRKDLRLKSRSNDTAVVEVGSGSYRFAVDA